MASSPSPTTLTAVVHLASSKASRASPHRRGCPPPVGSRRACPVRSLSAHGRISFLTSGTVKKNVEPCPAPTRPRSGRRGVPRSAYRSPGRCRCPDTPAGCAAAGRSRRPVRVLRLDADAVVVDGEDPFSLAAFGLETTWSTRDVDLRGSPRNLMALAIRFWNSCTSCDASASTIGRRVVGHDAPGLLDHGGQVKGLAQDRCAVGGYGRLTRVCRPASRPAGR